MLSQIKGLETYGMRFSFCGLGHTPGVGCGGGGGGSKIYFFRSWSCGILIEGDDE